VRRLKVRADDGCISMMKDVWDQADDLMSKARVFRDVGHLDTAYSSITEAIQLLEEVIEDGLVEREHKEILYSQLSRMCYTQAGILEKLGNINASLRSLEIGKTYDRTASKYSVGFNQAKVVVSLWLQSDHSVDDRELQTKLRSAIRSLNKLYADLSISHWNVADLGVLYLLNGQYEEAIETFDKYIHDFSFPSEPEIKAIRVVLERVWVEAIEFNHDLASITSEVFATLGGDPKSLVPRKKFHSCFISYSSKDDEFVRILYNDLTTNGITCWFAPEHMKIGEFVLRSVNNAIGGHDKLILVLSGNSIDSDWVEHEVNQALKRELASARLVLFPIRIDNTVFEAEFGWAKRIREAERGTGRHIGDFTSWENSKSYRKAFARLLRDLTFNDNA
jgi:tetratricopeptide (TPR) repeat protein